jgi:sirohydrochlorin ferrochelatase
VTSPTPLILAAHGSADPRFATVLESLASLITGRRPELVVRIGYLEHGPPNLRDVAGPDCVVVPVLLSSGFHVRHDIPEQAPDSIVTPAVGPDRRLTTALNRRLHEAGWHGERPVMLVATGSEDARAQADVHQSARALGDELGMEVSAAFLSAGEPLLTEVAPPAAVVSYLLAPGHFADVLAATGAAIVTAPIGADPVIAEIILDRYDAARTGDLAHTHPSSDATG